MDAALSRLPTFHAPFAPPDDGLAANLLADAARDRAAENRIDARAKRLIEAIRAKAGGLGGVEEFLHAYSLSTKEGLALMVLAEALLRVPDAATADRLIEDKLAAGRWRDGDVKSTALLVSASAWTLGIAARVIHPGDTPETILDSIVRRLGLPTVRAATRQAMRLLGSHFVLGQTIDEALHRARGHAEFRYSFDMLGEGARTAADADKYFDAYAGAIAAIGAQAGNAELPQRPGISVKLSALHPRYEAMSRERVLKELVPRWKDLRESAPAVGRGSVIGFIFGIIPGVSHVVSTFVSYAVEKRFSKHPEEFGKGAIAGVALLGLLAYHLSSKRDTRGLALYGNVDIRSVDLGFRVPGRIATIAVDEGAKVQEGNVRWRMGDL